MEAGSTSVSDGRNAAIFSPTQPFTIDTGEKFGAFLFRAGWRSPDNTLKWWGALKLGKIGKITIFAIFGLKWHRRSDLRSPSLQNRSRWVFELCNDLK